MFISNPIICYWNKKLLISYEGPLPIANVKRSRATFHELIAKLYQVTGYEKQYICLMVTDRYPMPKEYIALPVTDQEMMKVCFVVIEHRRNNLELYIDASVEELSTRKLYQSVTLFPRDDYVTCYGKLIIPI